MNLVELNKSFYYLLYRINNYFLKKIAYILWKFKNSIIKLIYSIKFIRYKAFNIIQDLDIKNLDYKVKYGINIFEN